MKLQNREEETGKAKITSAFNLPCKYVLHTVGPIVRGRLCKEDEEKLASCYRSCLELAEQSGVKSIAFCCISTGEFHFPNGRAAEIAVNTVNEYKSKTNSSMEVIFNVFKKMDYESTENYLSEIEKLKEKIEKADAIIIGAGAGLSTSAGLTYNGERFEKYFQTLKENTA